MYKDDLQAAHCRIKQLEGELEQCRNKCVCKDGFFKKALNKFLNMECFCGERLYKCFPLYVALGIVAAVFIYFL
jgi:hypothetical protein